MPIRAALVRHPDTSSSIERIDVEVARTIGRAGPRKLLLRYLVHGPMRTLRIPNWRGGKGERRDDLENATCYGAFVRADGDPLYYAFTFAPSCDWNAERFTSYREGMAPARVRTSEVQWAQMYPPRSGEEHSWAEHAEYGRDNGYQTAEVDLAEAMDLPLDRPWRIALSAVIEERSGRKSCWALAHPAGVLDFHHEACFALELPAAKSP